jgi:hypothetical protein
VDRGEGRQQDPGRRPLLIISGEKDNTVPWSIASASFKKQERNDGVTEIEEIPNRGHALTIDSGWREVADKALAFVKRFTRADEPERNVASMSMRAWPATERSNRRRPINCDAASPPIASGGEALVTWPTQRALGHCSALALVA